MTTAQTPGYTGYPDADLLAQLATEIAVLNLGCVVAFGSQADAENTTGAARVVFIDTEWQAMPRRIQPGDGNASFDGNRSYDVHIRAPEKGTLWRLYCKTVDAIDDICSWAGADVGKAGKIGQAANGAGSGGFGLVLPVIVKGPVYREAYGTAVAQSVTTSTIVADATGSDTLEDLG